MLQVRMINTFCGQDWWDRKKQKLQDARDEIKRKEKDAKLTDEKRQERARMKKVKKKMGVIRYFCCPCFRYKYRDLEGEKAYQTALDEKARRKAQILKERREYDLRMKNPITDAWVKFEKKIEPEKGGSETFIPKKEVKMERKRNERKENRADRRKKRLDDPDLNPRASKNGVDAEDDL